ncbi:Crp/Fnr family transcriptional regulator [Ammoniphilus resinae]|uniref:CRP/FNR family transcriptional regulator n=1 Tax=Ammoniphilus resinae TaxID=861532 RepID=A0ABS4GQ10_9BACL|nr:Crp/Fnr family transcriptional regulator [Ammoniphilus resinae]MBP1932355.1 CRP/FNR family transcriptional regulator [Ammoniphilus resinae]
MSCDHQNHAETCVRHVPVFTEMTDEEAELLQKVTYRHCYDKGEYIFQEGDPSNTLFVVHEGLIKLSKLSDEGKEQIIRLLFPGDFFGQFSLLENKNHYANAEVLEPTTVCEIHREDFIPVLERNPAMAIRFLLALSERLHQADEWISTISLLEVERRLAKALLLFHEKTKINHQQVLLPISKKDFASLIGTTPETLSRKLVYFESLGFLRLIGKKDVQILDPKGLLDLAGS